MITFRPVVYIIKCDKCFGIKRIKRNGYFVAGLGEVDRAEICQELSKWTGRKRKPQSKYSEEDRLQNTLKIMMYHKQQSFSRTSAQQ